MFDPLIERARRHRGLSAALAGLAAAGIMAVGELAYQMAEQATAKLRSVQAARYDALQMRALLADAETGQRGFLLTGREDYLDPMRAAEQRLPAVLSRLSAHYSGSAWETLVREARERCEEKLSELKLTVDLYRKGSHNAWQGLTLTNIGKEKMDAVRTATARLEDFEADRVASERTAVLRAMNFGRFGVHLLTLLAMAWLLYFLRKNDELHRMRREHAQALSDERDKLDSQVRERTAELTDLARHLTSVREDERAHLARELHDELGAQLTAAKLDLARAKRLAARGAPPELEERLRHLGQLLDESVNLKRRIVEDLRPSALANLGLTAALEILVRELGERSGLKIEAHCCEMEADANGQLAVYRLVQESLNNIVKHARAREVTLTMTHDGRQLHVRVRDDGCGFNPAAVPTGHHGLLGLRYRMESLGGALLVESRPDGGTVVEARLPFAVVSDADPG